MADTESTVAAQKASSEVKQKTSPLSTADAASALIRSEKKKSSISVTPKKHSRRKLQQRQRHLLGDDHQGTETESTALAAKEDSEIHRATRSNESGFGSGMMGMNNVMMPFGYGGMGGMYGSMGGMGMGFGGMYGSMGSQWLMSFNQLLFGIQSVVFSLGQAVQIVGMNAQQIRHVFESVRGMVENALGHVNSKLGGGNGVNTSSIENLRGETRRWFLLDDEHDVEGGQCRRDSARNGEEGRSRLTQSDIIRRRRLAALRWTMTLSASYFIYRAIRSLIFRALMHHRGAGGVGNYSLAHQRQQRIISRNNHYGGASNSEYYDHGMRGGYRGMNGHYDESDSFGYYGQQRRPRDSYYTHGHGDNIDRRY